VILISLSVSTNTVKGPPHLIPVQSYSLTFHRSSSLTVPRVRDTLHSTSFLTAAGPIRLLHPSIHSFIAMDSPYLPCTASQTLVYELQKPKAPSFNLAPPPPEPAHGRIDLRMCIMLVPSERRARERLMGVHGSLKYRTIIAIRNQHVMDLRPRQNTSLH